MNYAAARNRIFSGDVVGIETHGPLSPLIRLVQRLAGHGDRSSITHTGVAIWIDGRLFIVEMDGVRNVMCLMSQYADRRMHVFRCPVPSDRLLMDQFDQVLGKTIPYGYFDLIRIGARMLFGIGARQKRMADKADQVCSHFVLEWLKLAGWQPPADMPDEPSPCELCWPLSLRFVISKEI